MKSINLEDVFEQLMLAFQRRQFKMSNTHALSFSVYSEKHRNVPVSIIVETDIEEGIRIRIYNSYSIHPEKVKAMLQRHGDLFKENADDDIEKIIPADSGGYPDIEDIANRVTQAYFFVVS